MSHTIRTAAREDGSRLAEVLAHAFKHAPVHRWLFPSEADWRRASRRFWAQLLGRAFRHGLVLAPQGLEGAALWFPPQPAEDGLIEKLMFSARMLGLLRQRALRGWRVGQLLDTHRPHQPHWYLGVLGTAPEHRGKGISTAVMEPILRRCDAEGIPAYLESSNPINVPLYQRRGFEVIGEIAVAGGPTISPMLREPRRRVNPSQGGS